MFSITLQKCFYLLNLFTMCRITDINKTCSNFLSDGSTKGLGKRYVIWFLQKEMWNMWMYLWSEASRLIFLKKENRAAKSLQISSASSNASVRFDGNSRIPINSLEFAKKFFAPAYVSFWLLRKRVDAQNPDLTRKTFLTWLIRSFSRRRLPGCSYNAPRHDWKQHRHY